MRHIICASGLKKFKLKNFSYYNIIGIKLLLNYDYNVSSKLILRILINFLRWCGMVI